MGEEERQNIKQNFLNFKEEGLAFYVYDADYDLGNMLYRFRNNSIPGTYTYVGAEERDSIRVNFPDFIEEGEAFSIEI